MWQQIEATISEYLGDSFTIKSKSSVGGGCINSAFRISSGEQEYFIKLNSEDKLEMFIAEAEGLQELSSAMAIRVPEPVCYGTADGQAYIVMEALTMGGSKTNSMQQLGEQLAAMHQHTKDQFGWHRDNTIGSTPQLNKWHSNWIDFWREQRLGYQLKLAGKHGAGRGFLNKGEQLQDNLEVFFYDYQPEASLLHGDLWSGNYSILSNGEPVIFDPAVYYGDREADIAMTELFGGFGQEFYSAYNNAWPMGEGYKVRKTFYNLYHIINHFNLFGGGYASQAEGMMDRLLAEI